MSQRVLITAAAAGIGRSIAAAFIGNGARVHVCDVDPAALEAFRAEFPQAVATQVDLSDGAAIDAWLDDALADLCGVDVLVNNSGTKGPTAFVEDIAPEEWEQCLRVSLDSHFRCTRRVAGLMKAQRSGSVISISSMAGVYGFGMRTPYAAAKWAIVGLTKSLAIELGPHEVRCNCICPGTVDTPSLGDRINAFADPVEARKMFVARQPMGRLATAEEIAPIAVYLASDESRFATGQPFCVDGGTMI
ncbi:MAG: SDR family oxidoreductase [Burkholderiales bacterium]